MFGSVDRLLITCNFPASSCYLAVWNVLGLEAKGKLVLVDLLLEAFYTNSFKAVFKQKLPLWEIFEAPRGDVSATK